MRCVGVFKSRWVILVSKWEVALVRFHRLRLVQKAQSAGAVNNLYKASFG